MKYDLVFEGGGAKGMVFVGALQSVGWVKPAARPNTLQYGVIFCWVSLRSTQPTAGGSGAARRSKAGAMAHLRRTKRSAVQVSACWASGDSFTGLSRGWPVYDGCAPLNPCSGRCASTTFSLEKQKCEKPFYLQRNRLSFVIVLHSDDDLSSGVTLSKIPESFRNLT